MENVRTNFAYDFVLNGANEIELLKFQVQDITSNETGRLEHNRDVLFLGSIVPQDLEQSVLELRNQGYQSMNQIDLKSFDVFWNKSYMAAFHFALFGKNYRLLERVFDEEIVNGMCTLIIYITYVHVKTGKVYALKVGNYGIYNEDKIQYLKNLEYKSVVHSFLFPYIHQMDDMNKPLELNLKKETVRKLSK